MSEKQAANPYSDAGKEFWSGNSTRVRSNNFDPLSYFRSILKYRWSIMLVTALITALAIVYVVTVQPQYRSTQSLLLESTQSNIVAIEDLVKDAPKDEGYVQTRLEMLKSREHARRVISSLSLLDDMQFMEHLAQHSRIDIDRLMTAGHAVSRGAGSAVASSEQAIAADSYLMPLTETESEVESLAIDYLLSQLSFEQVPTTRLVRINYLSHDPALAARIANEVGLQYIQAYVESVQLKVAEVSSWLAVKLDELKQTLDDSESRLLAFKQENQLVDIKGSLGGLTEQELLQSTSELADARTELSNAGILLEELKSARTTDKLLDILPSTRSDLMVQRTQAEINRLTGELERQLLTYGERHSSIVALRSQLGSLRSDLGQAMQQAIDSAESNYVVLQRRVDSIQSRLAIDREAVQSIGAKSVQFDALEKAVETNRELYYRFLSRMIETKSTEGLESVNATIAEYAKPSLSPVKPQKGLIVGLAFIGALMLTVLAALIASGLDDSIKHLADVEYRLGERLIGIIPMFHKKKRWWNRLIPFNRGASQKNSQRFAEAFTTARTSIILDRQPQTTDKLLLLTSSVPGEGKSLSSVGLARSFAKIERVLLIDADIRRPSIGTALKLDKNTPGLTSYIAGKATLKECVHHHQKSGFDVLCSGPATNQPLEMLASSQFENLLHDLAEVYDRVIVDCAPVEAVSDALLLSKLVDQVVYIVKSHDTSVRMVNSGLEKLRSVNAPLAGVLLTQVDLEKLASYGAEYEFHGHYDYYGYSLPANEQTLTLEREELRSSYAGVRAGRKRSRRTISAEQDSAQSLNDLA